jgi:NADPH2:quinone reductase
MAKAMAKARLKSAAKRQAKAPPKTAAKATAKAATMKEPAGKKAAAAVKPYAMVAHGAGGPEVFTREEMEMPKPGKGEVLVAQKAIGLNYIDVYQRSGLYAAPGGYPAVLGSEAAGIVEAVGAGVKGVKKGDRVAYTMPGGGYASHRVVPADKLVKIPNGVSDEVAAAAMLKGLTAQYLIHDSYKVKKGDTVLVHAAAGGVGSILGQWLKAKGVNAIGTAGGAAKTALAKKDGFKQVIDYRVQDFVEEVAKLTKGKGVAAVYDSVGKDTYPGSLKCLRKFGTFVSFGQSSGTIENFKLTDLSANGSLFATRPTVFTFIAERKELERRAKQLFAVIKSGKVKIRVNQTFKLADVAKAHMALESRKTTGQSVLTV